MATNIKIKDFKINQLTEEQYENAKINNILNENEFYLTTDDNTTLSKEEKAIWHQLTNEIHYCEKNGVVFVYGESYGTKALTVGDYTLLGTLPQNLKPAKRIMIASDLFGGGNCTGLIDEKGGIYIYTTVENASYWRLSGSFPL